MSPVRCWRCNLSRWPCFWRASATQTFSSSYNVCSKGGQAMLWEETGFTVSTEWAGAQPITKLLQEGNCRHLIGWKAQHLICKKISPWPSSLFPHASICWQWSMSRRNFNDYRLVALWWCLSPPHHLWPQRTATTDPWMTPQTISSTRMLKCSLWMTVFNTIIIRLVTKLEDLGLNSTGATGFSASWLADLRCCRKVAIPNPSSPSTQEPPGVCGACTHTVELCFFFKRFT